MLNKKNLFFFLILFSSFFSHAQNRSNVWMLGVSCTTTGKHPRPAIDFNTGIADTFIVNRYIGFYITNTSICDTSGNLLFYTNGVSINNANHDTLFNSDNFNPGYASTINCNQLAITQGALILPKPNNDSLYFLLHESGEQFNAYGINGHVSPLNLKYSVIDMKLDVGLGGVTPAQKGIILINDTMTKGMMAACRHGNGRDWWIVAPRFWSASYYKMVLNPDSLYNHSFQTIGDSILYNVQSQALFSPDAANYANVDNINNLNIFRFDRCTGLFYDSTYIQVPNPTPSTYDNRTVGMAFSANSRFLYVILYSRILQYDMQASNIASSMLYVADWDTFSNPFPTYFLSAQLAPDNKIYIGTSASCFNLHYIDMPDSLGLACNVVQNTFAISSTNVTVPTFPNYDLGRWVGSPCDTLVGLLPSPFGEGLGVRLYPNPANTYFNINYNLLPNQTAHFILYNTMGEKVSEYNLYGTFKSLVVHTTGLPNGVYFYKVVLQNTIAASGKVVVVH